MTARKKVLIVDKLSREALEILSGEPSIEAVEVHTLDLEGKLQAARDASGILVRSGTRIDADFLARCERLEIVVRAGVGVDNIDLEAATRRGVVVENVPEGNTRSAAEHAVAMLLALCRNIPQAHARMKEGGWDRSKYVGSEFLGKTLGVVGLGKIGRHVQQMAVGLGMRTLGFDPFISPKLAEELGIELAADVGQLLSSSDFVTLHVPKTAETVGLISAEALAGARNGVLLVNCARGGIVDEAALLDALEKGIVGGAALDVFGEEPPGLTELVKHPRVVVTPHLGASTQEAQQNVAIGASRQLVEFFRSGKMTSPVNAAVLAPDLRESVAPLHDLAIALGRLQSQLLEGNPARVRIRFYGDAIEGAARRYIASGILRGFLEKHCEQPVNDVNAHHLAEAMGIVVEEASEGRSRYFHQMVKVVVSDSAGQREVGGTIRGHRGLRLVSLDSYQFDAVLEGTLLLIKNEDRPGMIGVVGNFLASKNVNISYMSLGRDTSGGTAMALLNLDEPVPAGIATELESLPGVLWARVASLEPGSAARGSSASK